ncbi:hypothetical protein GGG16DRAFT_129757 [Schizophyllum commune]
MRGAPRAKDAVGQIAHEAGRGSRPRSGASGSYLRRRLSDDRVGWTARLSVRVYTNEARGERCWAHDLARHLAIAVGHRRRCRRHEDRHEILASCTLFLRYPSRPAGGETMSVHDACVALMLPCKLRSPHTAFLPAARTADGRRDYAGTWRVNKHLQVVLFSGRGEAQPRRYIESMPSSSPYATSSRTSDLHHTRLDRVYELLSRPTHCRIPRHSRPRAREYLQGVKGCGTPVLHSHPLSPTTPTPLQTFDLPGSGIGVATQEYDVEVLHEAQGPLRKGAKSGASLRAPAKSSNTTPTPLLPLASTMPDAPSRKGDGDMGEAFCARRGAVYKDGRGEARRVEMRRSMREGRFPAR